jgi:hypothetical protein
VRVKEREMKRGGRERESKGGEREGGWIEENTKRWGE